MDFARHMAAPALIAFAVTVLSGPFLIRFMHRLKFGQYIREEGPRSHQKKSGTPTMGGVLFLSGLLVSMVICGLAGFGTPSLPVLLVTFGFALVGFLDDYIKVVMKRNLGLSAWQKMLGQFLVSTAFAFYMIRYSGAGTAVIVPFAGTTIDLGPLYAPILVFVLVGTANGSNFTDGLDGLATSVTLVIALFLAAVPAMVILGARSFGTDFLPGFAGDNINGVLMVCSGMIGCLLGFLCYNTNPAKIFMGDTGSLALGGFVASAAFLYRMPLFIPVIAFIYFIEVVSVIIQVFWFKRTGRRVFRMAPIHHHFELGGWPETKVVCIFSIVTAVLCLAGVLAL